jgi:transcriptional regulator with XRE-family HTH domain
MNSSIAILNAVQSKVGCTSDYQLSKVSGIHQATISSIRAGRCSLSRVNCAKAAEILGVEVGALIAIVTAEREEDQSIKESLLRVADKGLRIAASAGKGARRRAAAVVLLTAGAVAGPSLPSPVSAADSPSCVLCKVSRRRRIRRGTAYPRRGKPIICMGFFNGVSPKREVFPMRGRLSRGIVSAAA